MSLNLEIKKQDPRFLIISWDNEKWREVSKSLFFKDLLKLPSHLSWEEFIERFKQIEQAIAHRCAIELLSKRAYLAADLEAKLLSKGISPEVAQGAVQQCSAKGFVNDSEQILRLIAKELRKGLSAKAIFFKLKTKKAVDEGLLRQLLKSAAPSDRETLHQWLKKNARKIPHGDPTAIRKLMGKLCRMGFSPESVFDALHHHFK